MRLACNGSADNTRINIVALADRPPGSITPTTTELVPESPLDGVPETAPSAEICTQSGPLTLEKLRTSAGFRSEIFVAMLPVNAWPGVKSAMLNGSTLKVGLAFT